MIALTRRTLGAFAAAATLACAGGGGGDSSSGPPTLVLRNGTIVTVDSAKPEAQAIAMRGSTILAVGTNEEIDKLTGPNTEVVDLAGRMAMPGFIDSHGHYLRLGESKMILDLTTAKTWTDLIALVAATTRDTQPDVWIRGRGWHQDKLGAPPPGSVERIPTNAELSKVSSKNPVVLTHASGHASFVNKRALELAGITRASPNPPGGEIVKGPDGEPTGYLKETAQRLVNPAIAKADSARPPDERERLMRRQVELGGQAALAKGVTSFHDAGASFATIDFYKKMEAEHALPVRIYAMVRYESPEVMDTRLPQYRMTLEGDDYLTVRSIKRQIDGALGSHGALLLAPYVDLATSQGLVLDSIAELRRTAAVAAKHGFQVNTHAIGDSANRLVLNIYEETFKANAGKTDLRWRIEHAQHIDPADVPRFKQLGVIAAMQGVHATSDGPWIPNRLGGTRAIATSYVWRDLAKSGAVVANGTDTPVESVDPIASFYSSVSRLTNTGAVFSADQKMTREEALRSYTINGAYAAFEEAAKGSLTVGKLADVVVLSKNIMTVPEAEIPTAVVDLTVVGGKIKYRKR